MVYMVQDILSTGDGADIMKQASSFDLTSTMSGMGFSSTALLENGCQATEPVANGTGYGKVSNGTKTYNGRRKSSPGTGKFFSTNGYSLSPSSPDSLGRNGQLISGSPDVTNNYKNSSTNGHVLSASEYSSQESDKSTRLDNTIRNELPNGHTKSAPKEAKSSNGLKHKKSLESEQNGHKESDIPKTANGKVPLSSSSSVSNSSTHKDSSSEKSQPLQQEDFISSLKYIVILGAISAMAAIGITSAQDWLSFLIIAAQLAGIGVIIWAFVFHYRWFYVAIRTVLRDIRAGLRYGNLLIHVIYCQRRNWTFLYLFARNVKKHPNKTCFFFEDQIWTFRQVDEQSNKVANYFASRGLQKGDCVSVFMENRPQYVCIWLGLSKIGVIPALINFNLRCQPLKHCFEVAKPKAIIFGHELGEAIKEVKELGPLPDCDLFSTGHATSPVLFHALDLDGKIEEISSAAPFLKVPINFSDKLLYIFTSGTTGLPKAAVIKHSRFIFFTMGIHYFIGISDDEVIYDPLPLYHTAGGMIGVGQALIHGCTAVLRRKFSASAYFKDCARYKCTAAQYIGEICRYLLCQAPSADDTNHQVRLMFGNGLRPQIWENFAKRFNIKTISEFYGATEGNCNIINIDNHVGSVGFISMIAPFIYPVTLIRIDEGSGEPIRDQKTGLVLRCKPGEAGELVGKIVANHPVREFDGYADSSATTKKIVKDVFRKGDAAFRTGDILIMDEFGYFYFKDRTGDTFRWKGENCSTAEVEAVVSNVCGLKDAVVYGVEIPGTDGRAGMAAILDPEESLDFISLAQGITKSLPSYARPLFIRVVKQLDMTGTYKMKKVDLQKEGFDVTKISDSIYFFSGGKFLPMDNEMYSKILSGQIRV